MRRVALVEEVVAVVNEVVEVGWRCERGRRRAWSSIVVEVAS